MKLTIDLDHVDSTGAVFTMTVLGEPANEMAGTYRVEINKPVVLDLIVDEPIFEEGV